MTATRIDLVRHGHVDNPHRRVYGRLPGWKLSAEGRGQAAAVAQHLSRRPIVHIYSSPLERATETAAAIAAACGAAVSLDDALIESALGAHWEGLSWTEVRTRRHQELDAYLHRPHEVDFVDETFATLAERMTRALRAIAGLHDRRVRTGGLVAIELGSGTVCVVEQWEPPRSGKP